MDNWDITNLSAVTSILGDGLHGTPIYDEDGEYYFINGNNLVNGRIEVSNKDKKVSKPEFEKYKKTLNDRTILVSINGTLGNVAFYNNEKIVLGKSACYFNLLDSVDKYYVRYVLESDLFKKYINTFATGSIIKNISLKQMRDFEFRLPPLHIQKKLSYVLSTLDEKIALNNQINATLEQMAKALYDYWFVQFDFPDDNGKPYKSSGGEMVYNKTLKRDIPKGWEVKKLSEIAKTGSGGTPKSTVKEYYQNGTIPWINSGEVNNSIIVQTSNFITDLGLKESSAKLFPKNTILLAMYGATAGKASLLTFEATTNQAICAIMPNDEKYLIFLKTKLEQMYNYLVNLSSGSARDNLSQDKIKELQISIPTDELLEKFHLATRTMYEKIIVNSKENSELIKLRDWLLPMLMNGQVTVQ